MAKGFKLILATVVLFGIPEVGKFLHPCNCLMVTHLLPLFFGIDKVHGIIHPKTEQ